MGLRDWGILGHVQFDLISRPCIAHSMHLVMAEIHPNEEKLGWIICGLHCNQQLEASYSFQSKRVYDDFRFLWRSEKQDLSWQQKKTNHMSEPNHIPEMTPLILLWWTGELCCVSLRILEFDNAPGAASETCNIYGSENATQTPPNLAVWTLHLFISTHIQ